MKNTTSSGEFDYRPKKIDDMDLSLRTGLTRDYACFIIWNGGLSKEDEILRDMRKKFRLVGDWEVHWTKRYYHENISRLYESPIRPGIGQQALHQKVGPPPFRFILVHDPAPRYTWKRSASGLIEPTNEKVFQAKNEYRKLFDRDFQVHASNNWEECLFQSALILGSDCLNRALSETDEVRDVIHKDLEGAGGWSGWKELFTVLNIASTYLVQRNFETLPDTIDDGDIDFLTDHFQRLASLLGLHQNGNRPYKGDLQVAGELVQVDIRFPGDKYFPAVWGKEMLQRRELYRGMFVPALDDLFFATLYHCKVHKSNVKPKYASDLTRWAKQLRFDWFEGVDLEDDVACSKILRGYMRGQGLYYERPLDTKVGRNHRIIRRLPAAPTTSGLSGIRTNLISATRDPKRALEVLRKILVVYARKALRL